MTALQLSESCDRLLWLALSAAWRIVVWIAAAHAGLTEEPPQDRNESTELHCPTDSTLEERPQ
jgi:hypothetical protein